MSTKLLDRILFPLIVVEVLFSGYIGIGELSRHRVEDKVFRSLYHAADNEWTGRLWKWCPSAHSPFALDILCIAYMGKEKAEVFRWHVMGGRIFSVDERSADVSGIPTANSSHENGK